jgi:hypothetical protein
MTRDGHDRVINIPEDTLCALQPSMKTTTATRFTNIFNAIAAYIITLLTTPTSNIKIGPRSSGQD